MRAHRWRAIALLTGLVALVHLWLTYELAQEMKDLAPSSEIKRMAATYVSEIKLSAPPVAAAKPAVIKPASRAHPKPKRAPKPAKVASAPDEPASTPKVAEVEDAASSVVAIAKEPEVVQHDVAPPQTGASAARAGPVFVWPKATRVTYKMEGFFRGPIYGQAEVEWVRQDQQYQVHLVASVGPSFAPLGSWRLTSEGEILPEGLSPKRYENLNKLLFKSKAPSTVLFEADEVILSTGVHVPKPAGIQDPASQFIQLAYRFMMNPELLQVGNTIEVPLALLKKAVTISYDVVKEETLRTPLGDIPTFHVKPRSVANDKGDITAEIWFAPTLQYLPIRILARTNNDVFMDMQMDRPPQQASSSDGGQN